jgi:hypothetical protein
MGDVGIELRPDEPLWKEHLLEVYWRWERRLLFHFHFRPTIGHTLTAIARKPRD